MTLNIPVAALAVVGVIIVIAGVFQQGSIFLVRDTATDWTHTGIVTGADLDSFDTIEGNTNDDGLREGTEVCARSRGYTAKDFVAIK